MRFSTAFVLLSLFMTGSQVVATPLFFGGSTVEARASDFDDLDIRDFSEALLEARDYFAGFGDELEGREDELETRAIDPHHFRIGVVIH